MHKVLHSPVGYMRVNQLVSPEFVLLLPAARRTVCDSVPYMYNSLYKSVLQITCSVLCIYESQCMYMYVLLPFPLNIKELALQNSTL